MITPTKSFWEIFKATNGALSCAEAVAIMNLAAQAPNGFYMELGTHLGKSAMSALCGLSDGMFVLVDPIFEDKKILDKVADTVGAFSNGGGISLSPLYSTDIINNFDNYSYVFVDSGSHQDGLPMQEVKLLEDRIVQGGIIAFHDWNSQFKEVIEASDYLVGTGKYEYIPINWDEIISYVNENNLEEGNISWHHTELKNPCFVGAVKRK